MKTVKAQKEEGPKSMRDCKEVTQTAGLGKGPGFMGGSRLQFSARLDYVTLDLTNMSAFKAPSRRR
jgi:hypothetical protein